MKLGVSNIIWTKGEEHIEGFLALLKEGGIDAIELSLSSIWGEPYDITAKNARFLKNLLAKYELEVSALHSLTFTRPDLEFFGSLGKKEELVEYIKIYADFARVFETKNIVFGSPGCRKRHGKTKEECDEIYMGVLSRLDPCFDGLHLNIEPLSTAACEYLNTPLEAVEIVKNGGFKNIFVQLDLKSMYEEDAINKDEIVKNRDFFKHLQVSNSDFSPPSLEEIEMHRKIISILDEMGYDDFVSVEALLKKDEPLSSVKEHLQNFRTIYGSRA
jgi:sugar phosphate isomerase/epimerase